MNDRKKSFNNLIMLEIKLERKKNNLEYIGKD